MAKYILIMDNRKRQKNWFFFRLITIVVIISFPSENIVWTAPAPQTNTLSPASEIPAPNTSLSVQFTTEYFLKKIGVWSRETSLTISTLFDLLKNDTDNIRNDLNLNNLNVLYSDGKIELIGPYFTITFIDTAIPPEEDIWHTVPGTKIGFNVKIHGQERPVVAAQKAPRIKVAQRLIATIRNLFVAFTSPNTTFGINNSPRDLFEDMISCSDKLMEYIMNGRIFEIIPEWRDWEAMYENENYRKLHPISPGEHLLLAFKRLESGFFKAIAGKSGLKRKDLLVLKRALFLHDFGKIEILKKDPSYADNKQHPKESEAMARNILLRLEYAENEIKGDLFLIRHHSTLADFARYGKSDVEPLEFVRLLDNTKNLNLLYLLQLIDAASVRKEFENSLGIGLERRINELKQLIKSVLTSSERKRPGLEKMFTDYLNDIMRQNADIAKSYDQLRVVLKKNNIHIDPKLLDLAYRTMNRSHRGQMRKDGKTPYVIHPIETAIILVEELHEKDQNCIIAALLHDVLEDTRTTMGGLGQFFNKEIVSIVNLLSKPDAKLYTSRAERDRDYLHRLIYGTNEINDRRILTAAQRIKFAYRIHSLIKLETKVPGFAEKIIQGTYEIFVPYFIGETEVPLNNKKKLIRELIRSGKKHNVLTGGQIETLKDLANSIVAFKIPDKSVKWNPYVFVRGLVEYLQQLRPNTPVVLAFDGGSGAGKSTIADKLKEQLVKEGKKAVIFDARDYLRPRTLRDTALKEAIKRGEAYVEQREKLFDFKRFKAEVLNPIRAFIKSDIKQKQVTLTNLYNPDTGELDREDAYTIDRDTIIIVEGMHALQENFLPYYDATFLIYATQEVALNNVLLREERKPVGNRQPERKIRARFYQIDWPSYRKHWFEYWLGSGFIIDNTAPGNLLLGRNHCTRHPEKAPWVPYKYISTQLQGKMFDSSLPQETVLRMLAKHKWKKDKLVSISNYIVYESGGLFIKIPLEGKVVMEHTLKQFIARKLRYLYFIYAFVNKYYHFKFVRLFLEMIKSIIHHFKPQKIIGKEQLDGYRLILERAPHLMVPTRIIQYKELDKDIKLDGVNQSTTALILQEYQEKLLIDYILEQAASNSWAEIEQSIQQVLKLFCDLWAYGLANTDVGETIFKNFAVDKQGLAKLLDAGSITSEFDEALRNCEASRKDALFVLNLLNQSNLRYVLKLLKKQKEGNRFIGLAEFLLANFNDNTASRILKFYLRTLVDKFKPEELRALWGKNISAPPETGTDGSNERKGQPPPNGAVNSADQSTPIVSVSSIISRLKNYTDKTIADSPFTQDQAKADVISALKTFAGDPKKDIFDKSLVWHLLLKLEPEKDFRGKIIYSLKALLESGINDGNLTTRLRDLVEYNKGRIMFFVEKGFVLPGGYEFLKNNIITKKKFGGPVKTGELIVYMLTEEERKQLGIDNLNFGQLINNQVVIPVAAKGKRDIENDVLLGLEIIRGEGNIRSLPSVFRALLIRSIIAYLEEKGIAPTDEKVHEILKIDISITPADFAKDAKESATRIKEIIHSA